MIASLDSKLETLQQQVADAEAQLTALQKQASDTASAIAAQSQSQSQSQLGRQKERPIKRKPVAAPNAAAHATINGTDLCVQCNHDGPDRIYIVMPVPPLFTRDAVTGKIQPTRLGWSVLSLSLYLLAEHFLSTHLYPRHSLACERGICIYPNAPRRPFIILTLLWRASGLGYLMYIFWPLKIACVGVVGLLVRLYRVLVRAMPTSASASTGSTQEVAGAWLAGQTAAATGLSALFASLASNRWLAGRTSSTGQGGSDTAAATTSEPEDQFPAVKVAGDAVVDNRWRHRTLAPDELWT
ncbi:hypothetical protein KEM52_001380 [Ascosphaera acerosa]|nr:hypothetical protein KEM52_001380 [Ascosphaera acerosa]